MAPFTEIGLVLIRAHGVAYERAAFTCNGELFAAHRRLTAKVTSTIGLAEFVPVRWSGGGVEPLAAKYLPLATLCHADGWIVIAAASEGLPAGARVAAGIYAAGHARSHAERSPSG
jgi:hypothetical protein